jgi:hypothetical protein
MLHNTRQATAEFRPSTGPKVAVIWLSQSLDSYCQAIGVTIDGIWIGKGDLLYS